MQCINCFSCGHACWLLIIQQHKGWDQSLLEREHFGLVMNLCKRWSRQAAQHSTSFQFPFFGRKCWDFILFPITHAKTPVCRQ